MQAKQTVTHYAYIRKSNLDLFLECACALYGLLLTPIFMYADFRTMQTFLQFHQCKPVSYMSHIKVLKNYIAEEKKSPLEFERVFFRLLVFIQYRFEFYCEKRAREKKTEHNIGNDDTEKKTYEKRAAYMLVCM